VKVRAVQNQQKIRAGTEEGIGKNGCQTEKGSEFPGYKV